MATPVNSIQRNIYANTALVSPYPEYISVNWPFDDPERKTDQIEITVRSPATDGACGSTSMMALTRLEARKMAQAILDATE
jgi:hypothetical protein